jgi:type IV secretory pathway TraG/TraD family ATPase VirD4
LEVFSFLFLADSGLCFSPPPHITTVDFVRFHQKIALNSGFSYHEQDGLFWEIFFSKLFTSFGSRNKELLDGQLASVKTPLGRLASPGLYYILSGNECPLEINDPQVPKIVCLGGSAKSQQSLAPVQSLIVDRMCKMINKPGQYPSAIVCDEFSTVRAPAMITIIGTGRSNNISPVIAFQDYSQIKMLYSQQEAESLVNMAGNIVCGQVQGDTAKMVSDRFLKVMQKQVSKSYNSRDTSISESEHPGTAISPATLSNLSSGEFVGIVADDPDTPIELKGFHARIINDERKIDREKRGWKELPIIQKVDQATIEANRDRIRQEVKDLVKKVISGIPAL